MFVKLNLGIMRTTLCTTMTIRLG